MSDLERSGSRMPRRAREQRAYTLVLIGGGAGLAAGIGFVLAIAGVLGWGLPFIAAIVAIICLFLFRRTVRS